ncbi:MAG: hypothetical protein COA36_16355 [Desulfotalea sp.]|nr:MAG: hypothetical protein COA36_16355 [Desulfotalea sp.]
MTAFFITGVAEFLQNRFLLTLAVDRPFDGKIFYLSWCELLVVFHYYLLSKKLFFIAIKSERGLDGLLKRGEAFRTNAHPHARWFAKNCNQVVWGSPDLKIFRYLQVSSILVSRPHEFHLL